MNSYKIIDTGVNKNPDISIAMITYNHANYIGKAIESVLMQVTEYSYELVIADDFSTDGTRETISIYQEKYPQKIKLLLENKNVGAYENHQVLLSNLSGRYIAVLDGDDYWIDSGKLQEQVTFLENNPDFSMCFTNIKLIDGNGKTIKNELLKYSKDIFSHESFITKISPPTLTIVYRKEALPEVLPDDFKKVGNGDMFMKAMMSEHGKIKYLNKITGIKCLHPGGISSGKSYLKREETKLFTYSVMLKYFKSRTVKENLKKAMGKSYLRLLYHYALRREFKNFSRICKSFFDFSITNRLFPPVWLIFNKLKRN
jgi:glycosyltransferase involved in cell wall biosynthesis